MSAPNTTQYLKAKASFSGTSPTVCEGQVFEQCSALDTQWVSSAALRRQRSAHPPPGTRETSLRWMERREVHGG